MSEKKDGVIVHPVVDVDACGCVVLAKVEPKNVHFLSAAAEEIPEICPYCGERFTGRERILDHPLGEKGAIDEDGTRHAAVCLMLESASADPDLIAEIDEQDSTGKVIAPRFSLTKILSAIRIEARERGFRGPELDREIIRVISHVFRGINLLYLAREQAKQFIRREEVKIVEISDFKIAVPPPNVNQSQLQITLNEEFGVAGEIYAFRKGLGIQIFPGHSIDLRRLESYLPGWFIHSAGFLACWGHPKAPRDLPPPRGTPQNQEELLKLLKSVFGKSD